MQRIVRKTTKTKTKGVRVSKAVKAATGRAKPKSAAARKTSKVSKRLPSGTGSKKQREVVIHEFKSIINVSREQLRRWLDTPESRKLRFPDEPKNGDRSGELILKVLAKRQDKVTKEDVDFMRTVIEFIEPRLLKRPKGNIMASNWRYALMNWGHDPSKPMKRISGAK